MNSNTKTYYIDENDAGQRIDAFLSNICPELSRAYIQKQIKAGTVTVNDIVPKSSYILRTDDKILTNFISESDYKLLPENIPLDIRYEDPMMLIVNKPTNMLTHPTSTEKSGTLVNTLLFHYKNNLSNCNGENRPGIVHRLDRNTSGLLMISKNNDAYDFLKNSLQEHSVVKKYYAIVTGNLESDYGTIRTNIGRNPSKPQKMAVTVDGKPSVTHYNVLERFGKFTLIDINLETGRTHQIRVHMAHIGHPIANDSLYSGAKLPVKTDEQLLQAYSITFVSPFDNDKHTITIDYDNDIMKALNYLRSKK